jgi:drug/metabolite transporter (DMT)-like permease
LNFIRWLFLTHKIDMEKLKGYSLAIISAASYGLIPLFILPIKQINFPINTTLFYRFALSAAIIITILLFKKEKLGVTKKELFIMFFLGLFYGLSSDLLFMGYDYLTPGIASTILFVYPVIVAIIHILIFNEKIKNLTILSLLITLLGIFILSAQGSSLWDINLIGLGITLGSALFYALYIITVNKSKIKTSGWKLTGYSMVFTAGYYLIKSLINQDSLALPNVEMFFNFFIFALVTTVLSTTALVYAIKYIGSTPTAIMGALEPVVAVLVSVILFHEALTKNLILGVFLILLGVILNILSDQKKPKLKGKFKRKSNA